MNLLGQAAEQQALRFLQAKGLRYLASNMHCRVGEIDLIMQDKDELAFVEVRARRLGASVDALSSVSPQKQRRIVQASRYWIANNPQWHESPMRYDVIAIDGKQLHWERNAFDAL